MIIDKLSNAKYYSNLGKKISEAFEYLNHTNLLEIEPGKYHIDGENIFFMIFDYFTKPVESGLWEAHKNYLDIQYVIKGTEKIGYTNITNITTTIEYDASKDILFGEGKGDFLTVDADTFVIFFPSDAHMPGIYNDKPQNVKKMVIKVLID